MERAVTVNVEASHTAPDGRLHGHSYLVECWTCEIVDLSEFHATMRALADRIDHTVLEDSIGDPSMEAMAKWFGESGQLAGVIVRRPTLGFAVQWP